MTSSHAVSGWYVLLEEMPTTECSEWPAGISPECGEACFVSAQCWYQRQAGAHHLGCKTVAWHVVPE